jgi:type I restriction enzyme S subunit
MSTPALRFKEFDGDWVSSPLKKFFPKIRNGFVGIATPYYVANGVKYLQGKNVKDGSIDPTGLIYISEEFHAKKSNSKLAIDDILMVQSGHVGECAVIDKEYDNANCHALIVLSPPKEQKTNSYFVKYRTYALLLIDSLW